MHWFDCAKTRPADFDTSRLSGDTRTVLAAFSIDDMARLIAYRNAYVAGFFHECNHATEVRP